MQQATPVVAAVSMGYGHLRPAQALADALGTEVVRADAAPVAGEEEARLWARTRSLYEATTRWSNVPWIGSPLRALVAHFTDIPHLHPYRDLSKPNLAVRALQKAIGRGLGGGLAAMLRKTGRPLLTTHFATAFAAEAAGCPDVWCVVTDSDIHRVWAPPDPPRSRVRFFVPAMRSFRRLRSYGVPEERIEVTGYPLPGELLGDETLSVLRRNLQARMARLDPRRTFRDAYPDELRHFLGGVPGEEGAPLIVYAVGGAGAQAGMAGRLLPGMRRHLESGRLRLALVAGVRDEVADYFRTLVQKCGIEPLLGNGVEILHERDHASYFRRFNELLGRADILWSKPSEITFFGALGLALVLAPPVGVHESYNRRWARESGAALKQRDPRHAHQWLIEWLEDGVLASAAWSGFMRLPKFGLHRITRRLAQGQTPTSTTGS